MPDQSCKMHPKRIQKIEILALRMRNSLSAAAAATTTTENAYSLNACEDPARRRPSSHDPSSRPAGQEPRSVSSAFSERFMSPASLLSASSCCCVLLRHSPNLYPLRSFVVIAKFRPSAIFCCGSRGRGAQMQLLIRVSRLAERA